MIEKLGYINLFLLMVYIFFSVGRISGGKKKNIVFFFFIGILILVSYFFKMEILFPLGGMLLIIFQLFYDDEPFKLQIVWSLPLVIIASILSLVLNLGYFSLILGALIFLLLSIKKGQKSLRYLLPPLVVIALCYFIEMDILKISVVIILILYLDSVITNALSEVEISSEAFKNKVLTSQYNEIKNIYMQMRGYRHDYHSHIQTMKAHLKSNNLSLLNSYLNELENELTSIDLIVNTENRMLDAILNSKLTLAKKHGIKCDVKVNLEEKVTISDTDLCIILGNLLDNAIEACDEIKLSDRYIRLYLDSFNKQFYLSLQNSAKEILSFNEKNYISTKRGNHGLGMKRVALIVENYNGFLNLQNEPGIFAVEVTLPLKN